MERGTSRIRVQPRLHSIPSSSIPLGIMCPVSFRANMSDQIVFPRLIDATRPSIPLSLLADFTSPLSASLDVDTIDEGRAQTLRSRCPHTRTNPTPHTSHPNCVNCRLLMI